MDYRTINNLLEKYWDGETSIAEEKQLHHYFNQEKVAVELEEYRPLFVYFKEKQAVQISPDFESRIREQVQTEEPVIHKKQSMLFYISRVAAAAVFVFGITFLMQQRTERIQQQAEMWEDTYDDPKEALSKVKEMLMLVSNQMNRGTNKAASSMKKGQKATAKIKK